MNEKFKQPTPQGKFKLIWKVYLSSKVLGAQIEGIGVLSYPSFQPSVLKFLLFVYIISTI